MSIETEPPLTDGNNIGIVLINYPSDTQRFDPAACVPIRQLDNDATLT